MSKYRIKPLGFAILLIIFIVVLSVVASFIRQNSASDTLFYASEDESQTSYQGYFSLTTMGDAVNYKTKSIDFDFTLTPHEDYLHIAILADGFNGQIYLEKTRLLYQLDGMDDYYVLSYFALEEALGYDLNIESFINVVTLDNDVLLDIITSNKLDIKTAINPYISFSDSSNDHIDVFLDLKTTFELTREIGHVLSSDTQFTANLLSRLKMMYDTYQNSTLLSAFNLKSETLFSNLVYWKTDFPLSLEKRTVEIEKSLIQHFNPNSSLVVQFTLVENIINEMTIQSELKYNSCDASEWIECHITKTSYTVLKHPSEYTGFAGNLEDLRPLIESIY